MFFEKLTKRVEISVEGKRTRIYFLIKPEHNYVNDDKKNNFIEDIDRSDAEKKKQEIIDYAHFYYKDVKFILENNLHLGWKRFLTYFPYKKLVMFLLVICVTNCLIILNGMKHWEELPSQELDDQYRIIFRILALCQIGFSSIALISWLFTRYKVLVNFRIEKYKVAKNLNNITRAQVIKNYAVEIYDSPDFMFLFMILSTAIVSICADHLYWMISVQLVFFSAFSKNLRNIFFAIKIRAKQLLLISVFLLFLLFIYGLITYVYLRSNFANEEDPLCTTPMHCFMSQIDFGLRMGGGMGDNLGIIAWESKDFWVRFFFSIFHYIIFPIVMLNIVAGIIIDTFADLREQAAQLNYDLENVCLICSKEKNAINRDEGTFKQHCTQTHRVFDYMYYIMYLRDLPADNTDYYEAFVLQKMDANDITWIPDEGEEANAALNQIHDNLKVSLSEEIYNNCNNVVKVLSGVFGSKGKLNKSLSIGTKQPMSKKELTDEQNAEILLNSLAFDRFGQLFSK